MKYILVTLLWFFSALAGADIQSKTDEDAPLKRTEDSGIQQVTMETSGSCFGDCSSFSITISADGTIEHTSGEHTKLKFSRRGAVSVLEVNQLFDFINDTHFFDLQDRYTSNITDSQTRYTTVKTFNGKVKKITNYANSAPVRLWALEELILGFQLKANWEKPKK